MAARPTSSDTRTASVLATWLVAAGLILIVFLAFAPAMNNGFVDWDDPQNFLQNHAYQGFGRSEWVWAWTSDLLGVYQPLAWMLFSAQYAWAGQPEPTTFHRLSVVLHALVALTVFGVSLDLLNRVDGPSPTDGRAKGRSLSRVAAVGLATCLFAAHPLRVEVVAWASCQPYLPSALFAVLALWAYLRANPPESPRRPPWLAAAFASLTLSLLSKPIAVALPAVFLILDIYPLRRLGPGSWFGPLQRKVWYEKALLMVPATAGMIVAIVAKNHVHVLVPFREAGLGERLAQSCYSIVFYFLKTFDPRVLAYHYPRPSRIDFFTPSFMASLILVAGISSEIVYHRARWPGLLTAWTAFLTVLAPTSGLVSLQISLVADRYSYVGAICWVVPAAALLERLKHLAVAWWSGLVLVALFVVMSRSQCLTWKDSEAMWNHALEVGQGEPGVLHNNLGYLRAREGRLGHLDFRIHSA